MGSWLTRTRAWVYIAFYDEYVGRMIHTSAGFSIFMFVPLYLYGMRLNRTVEGNFNHMMYHWQFADKRNRLTHNLIMEHFEVHKERLEEVVDELDKHGPMIFYNLERKPNVMGRITYDHIALIDEMSGYTDFLKSFMNDHNIPESNRDAIRAYMTEYRGAKPKEIALNEMAIAMFGGTR